MQSLAPAQLALPAEPPPKSHDGLTAKAAAFGTRSLVRFAQWRGRKDAERELTRGAAPAFRGFIQINLIRPG